MNQRLGTTNDNNITIPIINSMERGLGPTPAAFSVKRVIYILQLNLAVLLKSFMNKIRKLELWRPFQKPFPRLRHHSVAIMHSINRNHSMTLIDFT